MDYFKQRRAYRNFKLYETDISIGQNDLYRELLDYANDEGKLDDEFPVKNSALVSLTGLSLSGLKTARNALQQLGLIKYEKGRKNSKAPVYKIIQLYGSMATNKATRETKSSSDRVTTVAQTVAIPVAQTVAHKELTSTDPDLTDTDSYDDDAGVTREQVINDWTNLWGFPNGVARPEIDEWLVAFKPELVAYAIQIAGEHDVQPRGALKYLRAVIKGWQQRKITTLAQAQQATADHDKRLANANKPDGYSKPCRKEVTPKWMQNGASQADSKPISDDNQQDDMSDEEFLALVNSQEEAK
ncbi:DnaD domain protein [Lactiplantibacillus plantarum]|uniref:DnaD domain protein n=1 Tax=Lactiplantibacillus plantarum TaxID=1590 RepID=UPI000975D88D|nr:DnaD domain protein [Lactiplantibacillus plantarum]